MRSHRLVFPALAALLTSCADPFGTFSSDVREPDIKATRVFFERVNSGNGEWIDTVAAGEDVFVMVRTVCAGEFLYYRMVITANADTVQDEQGGCIGDGTGSGGVVWGASKVTPRTPAITRTARITGVPGRRTGQTRVG